MQVAATININGVEYDSATGLPTGKESVKHPVAPSEVRKAVHSHGVHTRQQRSQTLSRQFVKKQQPAKKQAPLKPATGAKTIDVRRGMPQRSPHITKFSLEPAIAEAQAQVTSDVPPVHHPAVARTHARVAHKPVEHKTAQQKKHTAIAHALTNATPAKPHNHAKKRTRKRALNVASASLAVLLLAGYFTYMNMPSLSVRIAAAQAGIDASYPEYRPVGYSLNGPVAYRNGEVTMQFASNSGPQQFALSQTESSWDSSALLENYVDPKSSGRYATYTDAGLTVYTYGNNAAWVNGGVLYTLDGSATLSNEQVRRIATSM